MGTATCSEMMSSYQQILGLGRHLAPSPSQLIILICLVLILRIRIRDG
jgi:hypothetical protein